MYPKHFHKRGNKTQDDQESVKPRSPLWRDKTQNFSAAEVEAKFSKVNMDKSSGPNAMLPRLLNFCGTAVALLLSITFLT